MAKPATAIRVTVAKPATPQPAAAGWRNLFLAPASVRATTATTARPAVPPVPGAGTTFPTPPPLPLPPFPLPPVPVAPGVPTPTPPAVVPVVRPEVLGVVGGDRPQAILAYGDRVITAGVGDRTPWGTVLSIADGTVVLRTSAGRMTLRIGLLGAR